MFAGICQVRVHCERGRGSFLTERRTDAVARGRGGAVVVRGIGTRADREETVQEGAARQGGRERRRTGTGGWARVRAMGASGVVFWNTRPGKRGGSASPIVEG